MTDCMMITVTNSQAAKMRKLEGEYASDASLDFDGNVELVNEVRDHGQFVGFETYVINRRGKVIDRFGSDEVEALRATVTKLEAGR